MFEGGKLLDCFPLVIISLKNISVTAMMSPQTAHLTGGLLKVANAINTNTINTNNCPPDRRPLSV